MRILVIGAGEVGSSISASLADAHEVVVVDVDAERVESLTYSHDVLAIEGDGTSLSTLEDADVAEADMVIASTDDDETNLVACATARTASDAFTIARVRNTNFLRTWRQSEGAFGVDFMVCTNLLAAETIVRIAGLPAARDVDPFAGGRVQMAEFEVPEESPIAGKTVQEADRWEALTFAAVIDAEAVTVPTGRTVIEAGSKVVVIGTPDAVQEFAQALAPDERKARDVVVVGGGAIGYETARLLGDRGLKPRVIDHDADRARTLAEELPRAVVMCHDPTDADFLLREHVAEADLAVVSLESDERTLLVALLAKQIGTGRAVAVVENGEYVRLFEAVGVDVAVNPREVVAEEITRFTHEQQAENVAVIESDRAEVVEIEVDGESVLAGRPIRESAGDLPQGVVIGAITRNGDVVTPRGETVIESGDHIVVFADAEVVDEVLAAL